MTLHPEDFTPPGAHIKVIGVGGGGGNAVNTMIRNNIEGVDFITANTDIQALQHSLSPAKIQLGKELTRGLGAGADPDIGRDAALEDRHAIAEALGGANMVFVTAGMGGGTGTGGASVVAQIARELGALTVAVVTKPFAFEGKRRRKQAEIGIARLKEQVDTLISIPNQRLLDVASPELSMMDAFRMADHVLVNAVRGISDIINVHGNWNVDFADVKSVMSSKGMALMGIGVAEGEDCAVKAAEQAISSPLLEDVDIEGALGILINITSGENLTIHDLGKACAVVEDAAHEDANIIVGHAYDADMGDKIRVTVIATGFPSELPDAHELPPRSQPARNQDFLKPETYRVTPSMKKTENASRLSFSDFYQTPPPKKDPLPSSEPEAPPPKREPTPVFDSKALTEETLNPIPKTHEAKPLEIEDQSPLITPPPQKEPEGLRQGAIRSEEEPHPPKKDLQEVEKALELAGRLEEEFGEADSQSEDDLDIPAFLRTNMKDSPLT